MSRLDMPAIPEGQKRYIISYNGTQLDYRDAETAAEAMKDFLADAKNNSMDLWEANEDPEEPEGLI